MKHNLINSQTLCRFNHRFAFFICNLYEIVSARVTNIHADYYQIMDKAAYFWGRYEIQVSYRRSKEREDIRQKKFTRGFLVNLPYASAGLSEERRGTYTCEATCSYQLSPFLLMLFPFLSRINFVPFKVVLDMTGWIRESTGARIGCEGECGWLGDGGDPVCLEKDKRDEKSDPEGCKDQGEAAAEPVEDKDIVDLELIALEKKQIPPGPGTTSSVTREYNRFYNMLIEHEKSIQQQPARKAAAKKAPDNKPKKRQR